MIKINYNVTELLENSQGDLDDSCFIQELIEKCGFTKYIDENHLQHI